MSPALIAGRTNSYVQFIAILVIFVAVLAITAFTTRWIANYQKQTGMGTNIEIIETTRISTNKYIQIVRVGQTYMAIAVCKDTVTMLGEIPAEQMNLCHSSSGGSGFRELFEKALKKTSAQNASGETEVCETDRPKE